MLWALLAVFVGVVYSEFVGYFVHKLLHSEKIPALSRDHMIHHLKQYGPKMSMRSEEYYISSNERFNIGNVGLEWLVPLGIVVAASVGIMTLAGVPWWFQALMLGSAIGWGVIVFNYFHAGLHLTNFWMLKNKHLARWFKNARRLHDIHHTRISDEGRMHVNFGIFFFFFDRVFGTKADTTGHFNDPGYERAKERYKNIIA